MWYKLYVSNEFTTRFYESSEVKDHLWYGLWYLVNIKDCEYYLLRQKCPSLLNIIRVKVLLWYTKFTKMCPCLVSTVPELNLISLASVKADSLGYWGISCVLWESGGFTHACSDGYSPVDEPLLLCTRTKGARVSKMPVLRELPYHTS